MSTRTTVQQTSGEQAPWCRLCQFLRKHSLRTDGPFTLKSGAVSRYYLDVRKTAMMPEGVFLIGKVLYPRVMVAQPTAVGGMATGAIPLAVAMLHAAHGFLPSFTGFWVRPEPKGHGIGGIAGCLKAGDRAVILDDVCTSGDSALAAAVAVQATGATVAKVVALVDRLAGARELFEQHKLSYESVFTIRDLGVEP